MSRILLNLFSNYTVKHHNKVHKICEPLSRLVSTNYFSYQKVNNDGSYSVISNDPAYSEFYLSNQFYNYDTFLKHPRHYNYGMNIFLIKDELIQPTSPFSTLQDQCKRFFNFNQTLLIINRVNHYYEVFCFATPLTHPRALEGYINELNLIKSFIRYFKQGMGGILEEICEEGAKIQEIKSLDFYDQADDIKTSLDDSEREYLLEKFSPQEFGMRQQIKSLTKREKECLQWILQGKTADDTAKILGISRRTVELHRNSCKARLGNYLSLNSLSYLIGKYDLLN
jgi:DNA-binding CsgD family transcriptional regulator